MTTSEVINKREQEEKAAVKKQLRIKYALFYEIRAFITKLTATLFALAIIATACGVAYWTSQNVTTTFWQLAIYFCAACTFLNGGYALYVALMKVGK